MMDLPQKIYGEFLKIFSSVSAVKKVILFGSRARGDADPRSDIDICIEAPNASAREWIELLDQLEQVNTLLEMDIIRWEEASPSLRERILQEGEILYERLESQSELNQLG